MVNTLLFTNMELTREMAHCKGTWCKPGPRNVRFHVGFMLGRRVRSSASFSLRVGTSFGRFKKGKPQGTPLWGFKDAPKNKFGHFLASPLQRSGFGLPLSQISEGIDCVDTVDGCEIHFAPH